MNKCYWCLNLENCIICSDCERYFCNECTRKTRQCTKCMICSLNVQSGSTKNLENLSNQISDKTVRNETENCLNKLNEVNMENMVSVFDKIRYSTFQLLSDIRRVENEMEAALDCDRGDYIDSVLLPLSKLLIKQFMSVRIAKVAVDEVESNHSETKSEVMTTKYRFNEIVNADVDQDLGLIASQVDETEPMSCREQTVTSFVIKDDSPESKKSVQLENQVVKRGRPKLSSIMRNNSVKTAKLCSPVENREKNAHLVKSAVDLTYEKPFIVNKEVLMVPQTEPVPVATKTWSWEKPQFTLCNYAKSQRSRKRSYITISEPSECEILSEEHNDADYSPPKHIK